MARKYTGNSDGLSKEGAKPGLKKLVELFEKELGFNNMGTFVNRRMRNPEADKDPNNPKWLSVHATGRACDLGYKDRAKAVKVWDWLLQHTAALGIEEIHDYAFDSNTKDKELGWGRGYRCSRGEGAAGVKIYDSKDNAGSQGGKWIHIELSPDMAKDAAKFEKAWKAIPKPK